MKNDVDLQPTEVIVESIFNMDDNRRELTEIERALDRLEDVEAQLIEIWKGKFQDCPPDADRYLVDESMSPVRGGLRDELVTRANNVVVAAGGKAFTRFVAEHAHTVFPPPQPLDQLTIDLDVGIDQ